MDAIHLNWTRITNPNHLRKYSFFRIGNVDSFHTTTKNVVPSALVASIHFFVSMKFSLGQLALSTIFGIGNSTMSMNTNGRFLRLWLWELISFSNCYCVEIDHKVEWRASHVAHRTQLVERIACWYVWYARVVHNLCFDLLLHEVRAFHMWLMLHLANWSPSNLFVWQCWHLNFNVYTKYQSATDFLHLINFSGILSQQSKKSKTFIATMMTAIISFGTGFFLGTIFSLARNIPIRIRSYENLKKEKNIYKRSDSIWIDKSKQAVFESFYPNQIILIHVVWKSENTST